MSKHVRGKLVATIFFLASLGAKPLLASDAKETTAQAMLQKSITAIHDLSSHIHIEMAVTSSVVETNALAPEAFTTTGTCVVDQSADLLRWRRWDDSGESIDTLVTPQRRIYWLKNANIQYTESPAIIAQAAPIDRASADSGWFLNGDFFTHSGRFSLAGASKGNVQSNVSVDQVSGIDCQVVEVRGDTWTFRIWIAPSRGYSFAKYTYDEGGPQLPEEDHIVVNDVKFLKSGTGVWFIQAGKFASDWRDKLRRERQLNISVERNVIDLTPDFSKLKPFDLPLIPNGTPVIKSDADQNGKEIPASGLKYMWKDGAVVPAYDPGVIDQINRSLKGLSDDKGAATSKPERD